jgi:hypothetical protein
MHNLFLDDERFPIGDNWEIVRSYEEAVEFVLNNGLPRFVSFDHDLGTEKTGYDFAKWLLIILWIMILTVLIFTCILKIQ